MSHFTRIRTQMVQQDYLLKALADLNCRYETGNVQIGGFASRMRAEIKVSAPGIGRDIGFRRSGEAYEMVLDRWGLSKTRIDQFQQQVVQRYAYHAAVDQLQQQGFDLVQEESQEGGQLHLTLRRVA